MPSPRLRILDVAQQEDAGAWLSLWERWPRREVFAHPHYAKLYARPGARALCAAARSDEFNILYPFIYRDLTIEPYWPENLPAAADIVTPYGYGGPFAWGDGDAGRIAGAFWKAFEEWAARQNIVSEFVRFTLFPDDVLPYPGEQRERSPCVVRTLELGEEELWMDFEPKVRTKVKKALRSGVQIELDPAGARFDEFLRLYTATMDRREATADYYFPRDFFESIHRDLPGLFMYFHALHRGEVVSTSLVLISAENVYPFLGGSDRAAFSLCPNELLEYEKIRWARERGKQRFVLGGGYRPEDSIYRFKVAFAPRGRTPFMTGQRIFREDLYQRLTDARCAQARAEGTDWSPRPDYFPAYRASGVELPVSSE